MENLIHLKDLEYLNLALNNIKKIEGLQNCEFLIKLDLTINFIDFDTLEESIENLVCNKCLRDLYMMGNPCQSDWEGFQSFVIAKLGIPYSYCRIYCYFILDCYYICLLM